MWLLRKINRKKEKAYTLMNEVRLTCFPRTISFISDSIGISNKWEIVWLLLRKCSETAV